MCQCILARDLKTYSCTKTIKCVFIHCCCTIKHSASTEWDWNKYLHFQQMTSEHLLFNFSLMACTVYYYSFYEIPQKGEPQGNWIFQPSSIACLALLACLALCCMCFCVWWVHVIVSSCYKYPIRKGLSPRFSCHFFWTRATLLDLGPDFANLGFIWS